MLYDGTFEAGAVGMVKNLYQGQLFCGVSYGSGPTYKIFYQSNFTGFYPNADFRDQLREIGIDSTIDRYRIYFSKFTSGDSITLSLFKGYATYTGPGGSGDKLNKTIAYSTHGALTGYRFNKTIPHVSSFYMNFRLNGAIVERLEVDWHPNVN